MDPIPDAWPPPELAPHAGVAPLFPLPKVFLFPQQTVPLHVFEPRYRQMIEDCLDGPGRIVLGTVLEEGHGQLAGAPPVAAVAGLGEIGNHQRLADGRFLVLLFGLARVRIQEAPSERLYRRVRYELLAEVPATPAETRRLRDPLVAAVLERVDELLNLPTDLPLGVLADLLLELVEVPQSEMEPLFGELAAARRAQAALEVHRRYPPRAKGRRRRG